MDKIGPKISLQRGTLSDKNAVVHHEFLLLHQDVVKLYVAHDGWSDLRPVIFATEKNVTFGALDQAYQPVEMDSINDLGVLGLGRKRSVGEELLVGLPHSRFERRADRLVHQDIVGRDAHLFTA